MVRNAFVISDIHLGASTSLLTAIDYDPETHETIPRPQAETVLNLLIEDLRACCNGGRIEQCILLGDIFDLSFAPYGLAMQNGRWFFQKLIEADLFESFVYVPGNHDHHLWQQVSEHYYLLENLENPPLHFPRTLPPNVLLNDTILNGMMPAGHQLLITYPNYEATINGRRFYFHHGHYLQKLYVAASKLLSDAIHTKSIEDLELLNSPFLEFGWYNLGQAYNIGQQKLIDKLYFMIKNHQTEQFDRLLRLFLQKIDQWEPRNRRRWNVIGMMTDSLIKVVGPFLLKRLLFKHSQLFKKHQHASSIRHTRLSGSLYQSVLDYISNYLVPPETTGLECTFIFGHTHEPEENFVCHDAQQNCYHIYNTGGWVVDMLNEQGEWLIPQMAPVYLDETGGVHMLAFSQRHQAFLQQHLRSDTGFQRFKADQLRY